MEAPGHRRRLVVLVSGHGSNLQAVLDACATGRIHADVVAVICNRPEARAIERGHRAGVPVEVLLAADFADRAAYDAALATLLATYAPDWVVLAGWLRLLSSQVIDAVGGRIVNVHPALPGDLPGLHAIERAYDQALHGQRTRTGVMVHLVPDEGVDNGPVLASRAVDIDAGEPLEALASRLHELEHQLLVDTLASLCREEVTV